MSYCLRRLVSPIAAKVGILVVGMATPARADLEIWLSTSNNPPVAGDMVASGINTASYSNVNFGGTGLAVTTLSSAGNSPGTPSFAFISGSQTFLQNSSAGSLTVFLTLGNTDYTAPTAPPGSVKVLTSVSGTVADPGTGANSFSFNSYVNGSNAQNAVTGATTGSPQLLDITVVGAPSTSTTFSIGSLGGKYSLTERFQLTLSAGTAITFSSSTNLTKGPVVGGVPEPSTIVLGSLGALGLIGYGLRRRKDLGA